MKTRLNKIRLSGILFLLIISCHVNGQFVKNRELTVNYDYLKRNFKTPDSEYGVNCWWWWLNGNVTKQAITKDLEAMKSKRFQGAMIFDAGGHNQRGNNDIPAGPLFGSPEWRQLFLYALNEARRLDLQLGLNIQSGWNLGGPIITPQYQAKQLTYSEEKISGGKQLELKLKQPSSRNDFYKPIAVIAFPANAENLSSETITDLDLKLGFKELGGSAPDCRFLLENSSTQQKPSKNNKDTYLVKKEQIIDLTSKVNKDHVLTWQAPAGEWNIINVGYTCTNAEVSTSSKGWQGAVLDYMSKEAFDFYWDEVVEPIFKAVGDHVGTTLTYLETDSWECGGMNWTDQFEKEFKNYRGYDLRNYLPIIAGHVVGDVATTNAFLADFRKTLADLVAYNHYARFAENSHKYKLGIQPESAGPHAGPLDGIKNYGFSDIAMSEFWSPSPHRPNPENRFFIKQASSAAHIYGKKIVGAESFTTIGPHWNDELWHDQKSAFDHEICAGLNRMYFHTFTCSPKEAGLPGQEYFAGTHINPQLTWWNESGAFIDYMHRIQFLVQNGKFVPDALYYYGDHVPNVFPYKHSDPAGSMLGFDYDVTDETIFLQLTVKNGKIIVPTGIAYRVLVLPDHKVLSFEVLKKLEELVKLGAYVIGYKPEKLISLVGGEESQRQFHQLADKIWGKSLSDKGEKVYGKGKVVWGVTAKEYLQSQNIPVDFEVSGNTSKTDFDYIHYSLADCEYYFVSNQTPEKQSREFSFRISGKQPELWEPLAGSRRDAKAFSQKNGITTLPLDLDPYGSTIVVFHKPIEKNMQGKAKKNYPDYRLEKEISGSWSVQFDPNRGGLKQAIDFQHLTDWTTHPEEGIKYYSGAAVYNKTFTVDSTIDKSKSYYLQLGSVKDVGIAEVEINGINKGVVWTNPFRIDITDELKRGENTLKIKVVNSWYNRVLGEQNANLDKKYTKTNIVLSKDFLGNEKKSLSLEPSGLLGPVTIQSAVNK